jgi:DNA polymerase III epsilon subunit-like protein
MGWKTSSKVGNQSLENLNGNVICAIDTETTGLSPGHHDIIEVAVVPLDANLDPMKDVIPFDTLIKPKRPQNVDPKAMAVNKIKLEDLEINGLDPWRAGDLFWEWFQKLQLAPGKKIVPLGKNWAFDAGFIKDWLQPQMFNDVFHHRVRELSAVINFFNDRAEFQQPGSKAPFPQQALGDVAARLELNFERQAHRAIDDALMCARVYKKLMFHKIV